MGKPGMQTGVFPSTHWSVVLAAAGDDSPRAQRCLEDLCRAYWYPIYAFLRHRGHSPEDAQDLVQGFFAHLLEKRVLTKVQPDRGRFRTFLLTSLCHYVTQQWRRTHAQRRGAGSPHLPFELVSAEALYASHASAPLTPEELFDRSWAMGLLDEALRKLRVEFESAGRGELFAALEAHITESRPCPSYQQLAGRLGLAEPALRMIAARLRRRYGELVRLEVARTVVSSAEVEQELEDLMTALVRKG